jgi:hypothetical protein
MLAASVEARDVPAQDPAYRPTHPRDTTADLLGVPMPTPADERRGLLTVIAYTRA